MKHILCIALVAFGICTGQTQGFFPDDSNDRQFYFYWGWNRCAFTQSDIHFEGSGFDFRLMDVKARDRQSTFDVKVYLNPGLMTIPQYNFRLGWFFSPKYQVSFGIDHMKYVVVQDQEVPIKGEIGSSSPDFAGKYVGQPIKLTTNFLRFEHTDGLNYVNLELRRMDRLFGYKWINFYLLEGAGAGFLLPRTNTTLLGMERYDEFHLSGFGLGAMAGLNMRLGKHFFIQTEGKIGYIYMPDIRITKSEMDKADQQFLFAQWNVVFGGTFQF
ncbi:MAG: hypothetical protein KDC34_19820 [Saprospiraceae bacterium]|nr:hypothetical protein [Saprospiraceae bacterium]